jgi:hypothetical protein
MGIPWILLIVAAELLCGWVAAYISQRKGRSPVGGFILGLLLSWAGILVASVLSHGSGISVHSRFRWLLAPILILLAVSIVLVFRWESGRALAYEALRDGAYRVSDATFSEPWVGFCQGEYKNSGWRCGQGGFPCARVQVSCDVRAASSCEYLVHMGFSTKSGRRFGQTDEEQKSVSVPPGETKLVAFSLYRDCYSSETADGGTLHVQTANGERRAVIRFSR